MLSPLIPAVAGTSLVVFSTILYTYQEGFIPLLSPDKALYLASLYLSILLVGSAMVVYALVRFVIDGAKAVREEGVVSVRPLSLLPYLLTERRYRRYFAGAALLYALFYAYLTGTVVFGASLPPFADAVLPTSVIAACCGPPLFLPTVTVYLTGNLGLHLVPLVVILLIVISVSVGLNFALAAFAYHNRAGASSSTWVVGLGAIVGLFTGCPTCAGLLFGGLLGGVGAVSFAVFLANYQPAFIALSVPVLMATLYLASRSLSKVFKDGCVVLRN